MREAIEQAINRIVVGMDGTLTLETKPDGLLGRRARLRVSPGTPS